MDTHLKRHDEGVVMGSEQSFGLVFAALFAIIAAFPLVKGGSIRPGYLAVTAVFLALAFLRPQVLRPLNVLWFRFGLLLGRVMTPIVMGLIYATAVVPIGLALRAFGKDAMTREWAPAQKSYWIERNEPGPKPGSMKQQF